MKGYVEFEDTFYGEPGRITPMRMPEGVDLQNAWSKIECELALNRFKYVHQ